MSDQENTINPAFAKFDAMQPEELVKAMAELQARKERGEQVMKEINAELDFLRLVKIPGVFEERDIKIMNIAGVGRCNLSADVYASIKSGKKDDAFQWLRDNGRESLIQEAVNSSTLKAAIKDALRKGESFPEDLFNVTPFTRASITKG